MVNPDALPYPDSMKKLVELMESDSKLGAIQGKFRTDKGKIDTGRFIEDDGGVIRLHSAGIDPNKESLVSYVSGAMMMLRAEFPRRRGFIFYDLPFLHFDASALGLELYHNGYKVKYFPYETGYHKGKATTENKDSEYYIHISIFMFMLVTNSKFKRFLDDLTLSKPPIILNFISLFFSLTILATFMNSSQCLGSTYFPIPTTRSSLSLAT
ncbi:hypothetical protein GC250_05915 [Sulfolobus metallicus DSM 6482 = JCM 9184]|uniref:Glycosyltransferase n=1 Tax=Sulfuracidifex metallicus DSM 6482 = JCM 9184 TaxID=523847 RepID=A0A6A9QT85_SULME|nr:hypothetical protein [Sulfuracidifex metallicus DSM 6482 = JCM 9184]